MKKLLLVIAAIVLFSCEKHNIPEICWECRSIVYGKNITDIYCSEYITDVEDYKFRLMSFYDGGMTTIECEMIQKTE